MVEPQTARRPRQGRGRPGHSPDLSTAGGVIFGTQAGEVVRLDAKTGLPIATYPVKGQVRSQPVAVAGFIYLGTEDGRLVAIDTHDPSVTGRTTWGADPQRSGHAH
jgi:outer membrane protein assembly factor BamB